MSLYSLSYRFKTEIILLLDYLYPRFCLACSQNLNFSGTPFELCSSCLQMILRETRNRCWGCAQPTLSWTKKCSHCQNRSFPWKRLFSFYEYQDPLVPLIRLWKSGTRDKPVWPILKYLFLEKLKDWDFSDTDLVLPVPSTSQKKIVRGFNPAEKLARLVASSIKRPFDRRLLIRCHQKKSQRGLSREARKNNLKSAFQCRKPTPKRVLVVDDIVTTGSTLGEIVRVLKANGATRVYCLTFARTPSYLSF